MVNTKSTKTTKPAAKKPAAKPTTIERAAGNGADNTAVMAKSEGVFERVPWARLEANQLRNPRTAFADIVKQGRDNAALSMLADSIRINGLLEPIVVQDHGQVTQDTAPYVIIAGHRRWAAIGLLIDEGVWPADATVPCMVRCAAGAGDMLALSIIENLQREDPTPMDEAKAFKRLIKDAGWDTEQIRTAIGTTRRHVQKRLELVEKLAPEVQQAVEAGDLLLAQAQAMTIGDHAEQVEAMEGVQAGYWNYKTAEATRKTLLAGKPAVAIAAFEIDKYTGGFVDGDDDVDRRFADVEQFRALQREAAADMAKNGEKSCAWIEIFDEPAGRQFDRWRFDQAKSNEPSGVAVVIDRNWEVHVIDKLKRQPEPAPAAAGESKTPRPDFSKAHLAKANDIRTAALQGRVATHRAAALRLAVIGFAGAQDILIHTGDYHVVYEGSVPAIGEIIQQRSGGWPKHTGQRSDMPAAKLWDQLAALSDDDVLAILTAMTARCFGNWNRRNYDPPLGCSQLFQTVADYVGLNMAEEFGITEGYLATLDKRGLMELLGANNIGDASIADALDEMKVVAAEKRTAKQLREAVLALAEDGRFDGFVPREIRIGTADELKRPLTAATTSPSPAPKKAPAKKAKKKIDAKSGPKVEAKKKPAAANAEPARKAA